MQPVIKACTLDDLDALRKISYRTFNDAFGHMNILSNMKAYLDRAFDADKLRDELSDASSLFYLLHADGELAGYLKLNESAAQTDINDPQSIEIERVYVKKSFQSAGLGKLLLGKAKEVAAAKKKTYLWLGVWEKNDRAIAFYQKNGFYVIGKHPFFMGTEEQTDLIMRKDLSIV